MTDGRCSDCGAGVWVEAGTLNIQPHAIGCSVLKAIVEREQQGWCTECGERKITEDDGAVVYCPNGCSRQVIGEKVFEILDATGAGWVRETVK